MEVQRFSDTDAWLQACTAELSATDSVALSGGATPLIWFDYLAAVGFPAPRNLEVYWVDERLVAPENAESNFGNARRHWLDHVSGVALHPLTPAGYPPDWRVGQVWLGMGPDGHTASWFPGRADYAAAGLVTQVAPPTTVNPALPRMTLTLEGIMRAERVEMLLRGADRLALFLRSIESTPSADCPVSLLRPLCDRLKVWVLTE